MAKFNNSTSSTKMYTYEGSQAYARDPFKAWMNFLFSSFLDSTFYESSQEQIENFKSLTNKALLQYGPEFISKAVFYARHKLGMRSVTALAAAMLNGWRWKNKREFYRVFPKRPDDCAEVFAALDTLGEKRSHAMVRGFADYLATLDKYQMAKYKLKGHEYNMHDLINICHPQATLVVHLYTNNKLEAADTREVMLTTNTDKKSREKEWRRLVEEHKFGSLALLRNLRPILECSFINQYWCKEYLIPQILSIHNVFPYQIYIAYKKVKDYPIIVDALGTLFIDMCKESFRLEGKTALILDVSGSMDSPSSTHSSITCAEIGAVFAMMLFYSMSNIDFYKFGTTAKKADVIFSQIKSPFAMIDTICNNDYCGYGTDIAPVFNLLNQKNYKYDRIILISDMQVMNAHFWRKEPEINTYNDYCSKFGPTHMFSFDVSNYPNQLTYSDNPYIHYCTTLTDEVLKLIPLIEQDDIGALSHIINQYYLVHKLTK